MKKQNLPKLINNILIILLIIIFSIIIIKVFKDNIIFKKINNNITESFENSEEISNKILNNVYCINLQRSKDRWNEITKNANNEGLKLIRFEAVDGKKLNPIEIKDKCTDDYYKSVMKLNNYGNIGCYLSHTNLWKKLKLNKIEYALIIEDDIIFNDNFKTNLKNNLEKIPENWDIIFLGLTRPCGNNLNNNIYKISDGKCNKDNGGLFAYIVNVKNIDKIIKIADTPINKMIDHKIRDNYTKLDTYFIYPHLVKHNYNIESDRKAKKKYYSNYYISNANKLNSV